MSKFKVGDIITGKVTNNVYTVLSFHECGHNSKSILCESCNGVQMRCIIINPGNEIDFNDDLFRVVNVCPINAVKNKAASGNCTTLDQTEDLS